VKKKSEIKRSNQSDVVGDGLDVSTLPRDGEVYFHRRQRHAESSKTKTNSNQRAIQNEILMVFPLAQRKVERRKKKIGPQD
jgi:hypothetical protein